MTSRLDHWLESHGLEKYGTAFVEQEIGFSDLPYLTENDLKELGLPIGPRRRALSAISRLSAAQLPDPGDGDDAEGAPEAEIRQLTLVFVDLVGSTQLSNELDIEPYRDLLHDYQNVCLTVFREHHGHVAQFQGDGVLAYFGYPTAEEDDAERAARAGLEICRAIARSDRFAQRPVEVRIGISTGDVVVESREGHQGLALGEAPNLAARIQSVAAPGTVAISDDTKALLGANFECEWAGQHELKGFRDPVGIWVVREAGEAGLRFEARRHGRITPMIGREDEMLLLERRWQAARRGGLQVVMVSGEAGIGKSRLVQALSERAARDDALRLSFQCLPNHGASALFPVVAFIQHAARISPADDHVQRLEKLATLLAEWTEDVDANLPLFARLLSIPQSPDASDTEASPEQMRTQLQDALVALVRKMAERKPLLLLFEDLHWIDPSSEELIDLLIDRLEGASVLIVCTFRPDYQPRWTGLAGVRSLTIARLESRQAREMLQSLMQDLHVPPDLEAQIIAKTDGVPLFLEEMTRMVGQRLAAEDPGEPQQDVLALPSTLKDLLRARIDNLATPRDFVWACAAIGRTVPPAMLAVVTGRSEPAVVGMLDQLTDAQIMIPRHGGEETTYFFRHALIQDAVYELMLPSRARALHRRIAETIVEAFPEIAARTPEELAQHFARAGMSVEARDAWRRAAELATTQFATEETIRHLQAALSENARIDDEGERDAEELALRRLLNVALHTQAFGSIEIRENYGRLHELLLASGASTRDQFLALHVQFGAQLMLGDTASALDLCVSLDRIARSSDDPLIALVNAHNHAMVHFMSGAFDSAIGFFDNALTLRERVSLDEILEVYAAEVRTVDIAMRAWALAIRSADREAVARAIPVAEAEPHDFSRCYALSILAAAQQVVGNVEEVTRLTETALALSEERKFKYWSAWCAVLHGWAVARSGDPSAGIDELERGFQDYLATGSTQMTLYARTLLADAWLAANNDELTLTLVEAVRTDPLAAALRYHVSLTDRVEADATQPDETAS